MKDLLAVGLPALTTVLALVALATFSIMFALGLGRGGSATFGVLITAASLNILGSMDTILVVYWRFSNDTRRLTPTHWGVRFPISIMVAVIVTAFEVASLLFIEFYPEEKAAYIFGVDTSRIVYSAFAVWAVCVFAYIILFAACTSPTRTTQAIDAGCSPPLAPQPAEMRAHTPVSATNSWTSPHGRYSWPSSPALSSVSWDGKTSMHSVSQVHLITVPRVPSPARESWPSGNNVFAALPTPAELHKMRSHTYSNPRTVSRRNTIINFRKLEPIPGSRPTSVVVDGVERTPLQPIDANSQSVPIRISKSKTRRALVRSQSTPIYIYEDENSSPESQTSEAVHEIKRKRFSADQEAHIHPLFRAGSHLPPPKTTHGTTLVASSLAGQTISVRDLSTRGAPSRKVRNATSISSISSLRSSCHSITAEAIELR